MQLLKEQFVEHWQGLHLLNPFTAPACKNFWAERCMDVPANSISAITSYPIQTVYLPLLYKQYICHSYTMAIYFQCDVFQWKSFHLPVQKRRQNS